MWLASEDTAEVKADFSPVILLDGGHGLSELKSETRDQRWLLKALLFLVMELGLGYNKFWDNRRAHRAIWNQSFSCCTGGSLYTEAGVYCHLPGLGLTFLEDRGPGRAGQRPSSWLSRILPEE